MYRRTLRAADAEQILSADAPLDALHSLCRNQLLVFDGQTFGMLESIRAFAREEELDADTIERHIDWCLAAAAAHHARLESVEASAALDGLADLLPELRVLVRRAPKTPRQAEAAWEAATCLATLLDRRGPVAGRLALLEGLLKRDGDSPHRAGLMVYQARWLRRSGSLERSAAVLEDVLSRPDASDVVRARALLAKVNLMSRQEKPEEAEPLFAEAIPLAAGSPALECLLRIEHAFIVHDLYDYPRSRQLGQAALQRARELALPTLEAQTLSMFGTILLEQTRLDEAAEMCRQARRAFARLGNLHKVGYMTGQLALIAEVEERLEESAALYTEAIELLQAASSELLAASYQSCIGRLRLCQGRWEEGGALLRTALKTVVRFRSTRETNICVQWLAVVLARAGKLADIRALPEQETLPPRGQAVMALAETVALIRADPRPLRDRLGEVQALAEPLISCGFLWGRMGSLLLSVAEEGLQTWIIAAGGETIWAPDGAEISLTRRPTHGRILRALLSAWQADAQPLCSIADLTAAGWPDEVVLESAAANRVSVALSGLRKAGLAPLIQRQRGGWRLNPDLPIRLVTTS